MQRTITTVAPTALRLAGVEIPESFDSPDEELLALKRACQTLGLGKQDVEDMLYNNAMNLISGARHDIYGEQGRKTE